MSEQELKIISKIIKRVHNVIVDYPDDNLTLFMDIENCHKQIPLNLKGLLLSDNSDLIHDICGIRRHINRSSGQMEGIFVPRCAL